MLFSFRPTTLRTEEEEGDFARGLLSLPELSRKIEEDSARRVSPYWQSGLTVSSTLRKVTLKTILAFFPTRLPCWRA